MESKVNRKTTGFDGRGLLSGSYRVARYYKFSSQQTAAVKHGPREPFKALVFSASGSHHRNPANFPSLSPLVYQALCSTPLTGGSRRDDNLEKYPVP
jgi:hypothetical protein